MLELKIKTPTHTAKLLINIAHIIYADYIENDILLVYVHCNQPPLELTDKVLMDTTIEAVYQKLKMMLDNHNNPNN